MLAIGKATYKKKWEKHMAELRRVNFRAYNKLIVIELRSWAREFFSFEA